MTDKQIERFFALLLKLREEVPNDSEGAKKIAEVMKLVSERMPIYA